MSVIEGKAQLVDSFRIRRNDADITKIEIPPNSVSFTIFEYSIREVALHILLKRHSYSNYLVRLIARYFS